LPPYSVEANRSPNDIRKPHSYHALALTVVRFVQVFTRESARIVSCFIGAFSFSLRFKVGPKQGPQTRGSVFLKLSNA